MDVRAFGSVYGQSSSLPYASGYQVVPSGDMGRVNFPASRGFFIEAKSNNSKGYLSVVMTDSPAESIHINNIDGNIFMPLSITAILSGTVNHCVVLF